MNKAEKLSSYLGDYNKRLGTNVDSLWDTFDGSKSGYLDQDEAHQFIEGLAKRVPRDMLSGYDQRHFDLLFDSFDEDNNEYLTKLEMVWFSSQIMCVTTVILFC